VKALPKRRLGLREITPVGEAIVPVGVDVPVDDGQRVTRTIAGSISRLSTATSDSLAP
jgi:hypothetical protein